jgi:hypothetical protein
MTAYDHQYAIAAFDAQAVDYALKMHAVETPTTPPNGPRKP